MSSLSCNSLALSNSILLCLIASDSSDHYPNICRFACKMLAHLPSLLTPINLRLYSISSDKLRTLLILF